jgi:hypothetical protein
MLPGQHGITREINGNNTTITFVTSYKSISVLLLCGRWKRMKSAIVVDVLKSKML